MSATLPTIWFERPIIPDLMGEVIAAATVLTPGGDAADPYAGVGEARGLIAGILPYRAPVMAGAPRLRVICRLGIGYDAVDVDEATRRGIAVCNTPDGPTVSTAEHAVALILAVAKRLKRSERWLREGEPEVYGRHEAMELDGKTLGLVGYGRIPRRIAAVGRSLGMRVAAFDPYLAPAAFAGAELVATLPTLLAMSDVVSVHVPLTSDTRHMFSSDEFAAMRPGSIFVNTARGGVVDQEALLAALEAGQLMGAGLDVTDPEPLPSQHLLLHRDDVVVTPHVASGTSEGKRRIFRMAFNQVLQVLRGQRPDNLLNPAVWDRVAAAVAADNE